jgi:molybdate transport system substrate-binding protein
VNVRVAPFGFLLVCACTQTSSPLVVSAASSLTEVLRALEPQVERSLERDVDFAFAGSQALRLQIEQGAPVDVFLSANAAHVDALVAAGLGGAPRRFAANVLTVAVPESNPAGLERFEDLGRASRIVVGAEEVPVGRYTAEVLGRVTARDDALAARIHRAVVSRENNVRLVLAKVELGEADAAIVYRTDVTGRRVKTIEIPSELQVEASYFATVIEDSDEARAFVELLTGPVGRAALRAHGFVAR